MAKVLVSGATGFVGKRLIISLLEQGHDVYALCRISGTQVFPQAKERLHYLWGDLRNPATLDAFPKELDAAYYLVHSMTEIVSDLVEAELASARNFVRGLQRTSTKQIIYLGGIIDDDGTLSTHLRSRLLVEGELREGGIPLTVLRASIIIGSGSASFEIIKDLTEKLPFMVAPKWVSIPCQPIAVRDAIFYLSNVLLKEQCYGKVFDIGGPEVLTFKQLLQGYARVKGLKRWIVEVPVLTPRLSSYWLVFITSVRFSLCAYLVDSMKYPSVVKLGGIKKILPHECLSYEEAIKEALGVMQKRAVVSSWMDSWEIEGASPAIADYLAVPQNGCLTDIQRVPVRCSKEEAVSRIWRIGGDTGWYAMDWAWRLRGFIDRVFGGVGLNRGRRDPAELQAGDPIDFWRVVEADKEKGRLLLYSGMKVPGRAWLEFRLEKGAKGWELVQTATFEPDGYLGSLYWYAMFPFHLYIFKRMASTIAAR